MNFSFMSTPFRIADRDCSKKLAPTGVGALYVPPTTTTTKSIVVDVVVVVPLALALPCMQVSLFLMQCHAM